MVGSAVLGAATGTGLALVVAMTIVIYRYYKQKRYGKEWGNLDRGIKTKGGYSVLQKEFHLSKEQRVVQPTNLNSSSQPLLSDSTPRSPHELTHQAKSYPGGTPRLHRAPSISSQGSLDSCMSKQGSDHRSASPQIRTFCPDGRTTMTGQAGIDTATRSPSPLRQAQNSSQGSLNSLTSSVSSIVPSSPRHTAAGRCLSPLLIPNNMRSLSAESPLPPASPLGALQPDLYTKKDAPVFLSTPMSGPSLGKIHLRLNYDFNRSDLHVHLIEAHDLSSSECGGFNDPYIRLQLSPAVDNRKRQTPISRQDSNPYFDQTFKFPVSHEELQEKTLVVQIFDYDRFSRNDVIGEVRLPLGEIEVATSVEVWGDISKNKKPREEFQEILVSLSYLPSAERLTVTVLKASNLFLPSDKDVIDPFVKVYLIAEGKRSKKKKTAVRKGSRNPVWNEALTFNISASNLPKAAIEICVLDQGTDLIGHNPLLGCCLLGPSEEGPERGHWEEMVNGPRKAVAMWHTLR